MHGSKVNNIQAKPNGRFLLFQSWKYFRLYLFFGCFPCTLVNVKYPGNDKKEFRRVRLPVFIATIMVWTSVAVFMAYGSLYYFGYLSALEKYPSNSTLSMVDFSTSVVMSVNLTTTDVFTGSSSIAVLLLLYWLINIKNYMLGKDLQSLVEMFDSVEASIVRSDIKKKLMTNSTLHKFCNPHFVLE